MVPNSAEQVALISSALVSIMVILVGDYYRSISRRELSDLHELHELSATLASIPGLSEQLKLILSTFARMHGATQGIICTYEARGDTLTVAASIGFGQTAASLRASSTAVRVVVSGHRVGSRCAAGLRDQLRAAGHSRGAFDAADQS